MKRIGFVIAFVLSACAEEQQERIDARGPNTWDGPPLVSIAQAPEAAPVPICDRLPEGTGCCSLACDPVALQEQCGVPGVCITYVCQTTDGEDFSVGVCTPPLVDAAEAIDAGTSDQCDGYWCPPADAAWPEE